MSTRITNASGCFRALAVSSLHEEAYRWLLRNVDHVEAARKKGSGTPKWQPHADKALIHSVRWNRYLVKPLLRCGANAAFNDSESLTIAAKMSALGHAEDLIAHGAKAYDGESRCLSAGILMGERPMVELLLAHRANPKARHSQALHESAKLNYHDIFLLLLDAGGEPRARGAETLTVAAAHASVECVSTLLARVEYSRKELLIAAGEAAPSAFAIIRDRLRALDSQGAGPRQELLPARSGQ